MKKKVLAEAASFKRKLPFFEKLSAQEKLVLQKDCKYDAVFEYSLNNCFVTPYGAVFKNGLIVKESLYRNYKKNTFRQYPSFYKKLLKGKSVKVNDDCIVAHHSWFDNYYHFLVEIVPRLLLLKDSFSKSTLLIHEGIKPFHREIISFFDFNKIVYIKDDEMVYAKKLTFLSFNRGDIKYRLHNYLSEPGMNKDLLRKVSELIILKTADDNIEKRSKIYISRQKAGHRKVLNQKELEDYLLSEGFKIVYMEDHDFREQVNIINKADIIVGVCGAGLSNILFMKKQATIINLINKDIQEFCFYNLANAMDVNYAHFTCEGNSKPNPAYNDIFVNINELKNVLNSIKN